MNTVMPSGLVNILSGYGPECGAPLVSHPKVGKVTFTGSVETGKIVYKAAAEKLIPVTLELGGKSPMIVMEDADLDRAVAGAIAGMRFTRQGQSCTAASRIFVHDSLHDAFVEKLKAKVDAMKMGDPLDEATDIGTIVSPQQMDRVQGYIAIGKKTPGAVAHACSAMPTRPEAGQGPVRPAAYLHRPRPTTASSRARKSSARSAASSAGPTTNRSIADANDSEYGLAATVWTNNLHKAMDAVNRLEAGFVQVNQNLVVQPNLSYGGVKASGLGKEASLESMLEHFTHKKTIMINMA